MTETTTMEVTVMCEVEYIDHGADEPELVSMTPCLGAATLNGLPESERRSMVRYIMREMEQQAEQRATEAAIAAEPRRNGTW